ncbi:MAG: hypothetical protein ACM32I_07275 [Nitrospirota bacterium]
MIRKKEPSGDNLSEPFESYDMSGTSTSSPYNRYLRIEDIKYVTGLRDVKQVEFHPAEFLGGDLNFVNELGGKILCVAFFRASLYNTYWAAVPKSLKTRVNDVGDDAFFVLDLNGREPFMLVFRMGNHAVSLTTATTKEAKRNLLTVDELITIGNIIASRLEER